LTNEGIIGIAQFHRNLSALALIVTGVGVLLVLRAYPKTLFADGA
jgi:hypothetical protein